jgi:3-oxoacyl-[acyl-carrier protein] reductase
MAGRRVLITGATRGIGAALVQHCLDAGDEVIGCGRSTTAVSDPRYTHYAVDVTAPGEVRKLFEDLRSRFSTLDVLVNNAGVASMNAIALTPDETARRIVDTNVVAPFAFTREALRLLRRSRAGRIVNISSVAVPLRLEGEALYAASKSALETFTRITAREFGPFGITCNAIGPSPIRTQLVAGVPAAKLQAMVDAQAVRRWATVEDVVNVVDFFLREESSMVTGQVIYLGGAG